MGGRTLSTERPGGRSTGGGEFELATWKVFSSAALPNPFVVERMLAGVATSRHVDVAEPGQDRTSDPGCTWQDPLRLVHRRDARRGRDAG
jgi:hypothetical protein